MLLVLVCEAQKILHTEKINTANFVVGKVGQKKKERITYSHDNVKTSAVVCMHRYVGVARESGQIQQNRESYR